MMSYLLCFASLATALFTVLGAHPFQNEIVNAICFPLLSSVWTVLMCVASDIEDRYKKRIENLENEVKTLTGKGEG